MKGEEHGLFTVWKYSEHIAVYSCIGIELDLSHHLGLVAKDLCEVAALTGE